MDPQAAYASRWLGADLACWSDSSFPMRVSIVVTPSDHMQQCANEFNATGKRFWMEVPVNCLLLPGLCNWIAFHKN